MLQEHYATIIGVNYNASDAGLVNVLQEITTVEYEEVSMYNFDSKSATLQTDLTWALTQSNCYCGDVFGGMRLVLFDDSMQRYERFAECMTFWEWSCSGDLCPPNAMGICNNAGLEQGFIWVPAALSSKKREDFVGSHYDVTNQFYTGLHRNNQSQWEWFLYDGTDYAMGNYTNWETGFNNNSPGDCGIAADFDGSGVKWETGSCKTADTGILNSLCMHRACHAENHLCNNDTFSCFGPECDINPMPKERGFRHMMIDENGKTYLADGNRRFYPK